MGDREEERLGLAVLGERLRLTRSSRDVRVDNGSRCKGLGMLFALGDAKSDGGRSVGRGGNEAVICRCRASASAVLPSNFPRRLDSSDAGVLPALLLLSSLLASSPPAASSTVIACECGVKDARDASCACECGVQDARDASCACECGVKDARDAAGGSEGRETSGAAVVEAAPRSLGGVALQAPSYSQLAVDALFSVRGRTHRRAARCCATDRI